MLSAASIIQTYFPTLILIRYVNRQGRFSHILLDDINIIVIKKDVKIIQNMESLIFETKNITLRYQPNHGRVTYKIFVKFRNSKKHLLKIVLIIVNINKDENKSLISNKLSLKNDL